MTNTSQAFYDSTKSYEENYDAGPFGLFRQEPPSFATPVHPSSFLGFSVDVPFGIPAGPLLNSKFVVAAWNWGFSLATYKTVRGNVYPSHPFPNVIRVATPSPNVLPGDTLVGNMNMNNIEIEKDGITNSFGVPSKAPDVWQADVKKALESQTPGNVMILSFMGTKVEDMTADMYVADFAKTAKLAKDTGASILEVNFSCPNVGKEGLICNDVETSKKILEAIHAVKGNTPLLVKIGYFPRESQAVLEQLLDAIHEYAQGVAAINTIQVKVVTSDGAQALPGSAVRLQSGVCGVPIRWAGKEMIERIAAVKRQKNWKDFVLVGIGGVTQTSDYYAYRSLGADAVMSATGAMWKPSLAIDVRASL